MKRYQSRFNPASVRVFQMALLGALCSGVGVFVAHVSVLLHLKGYNSLYIGIFSGIQNTSGIIGPLIITRMLQRAQNFKLTIVVMAVSSLAVVLGMWRTDAIVINFFLIFLLGFMLSSFSPVMEATYVTFLHNPYREYGLVRTSASIGYLILSLCIALFPIVNIGSKGSVAGFGIVVFVIAILFSLLLIPKLEENENDKEERNRRENFREVLGGMHPAFFIMLLFVFFNFVGLRTIETYIGLMAIEYYDMKNITSLLVVSVGFEIVTIYFGQRIVERIGYIIPWIIVLSGTILRMLLLSFVHYKFALYLSQSLHIASFGLMLSTVIHFVNHGMKPKNKSIAMGFFQVMISVATVIAVVLGGYILSIFGDRYEKMFLFMAIWPLLGLVAVLLYIPKIKYSRIFEERAKTSSEHN